jgi:hypothetical protein
MNTTRTPILVQSFAILARMSLLGLICLTSLMSVPCHAQEESDQASPPAQEQPEQASVSSSIGKDGTGTIIVEARGQLPEPSVFYTANADATAQVGPKHIDQVIQLTIKVIQGKAKTLSFGLNGEGDVTEVQDANLQSWSVRQEGGQRFLDLHLRENVTELKPVIKIRSPELKLPARSI